MIIFYGAIEHTPGKRYIYEAVMDSDAPGHIPTANVPVSALRIDELEANKPLMRALINAMSQRKQDAAGQERYYIDADGDLCEVDGWTPEEVTP